MPYIIEPVLEERMSDTRFVDLIIKKRDGGELKDDEIREMIRAYTDGDIPDYQMSAMLMAVFYSGMNDRELTTLTLAMRDSGETVDLSSIPGIKVDKHSTGGVGDKTTMIIGPIVAACGVPVAKMSGRGLGFTGGTVDKFESIPGYRTELTMGEFLSNVKKHGIAAVGQSGELAPADKLIYALRDVTGTVESIPLIASSIMSKKLAAGADKILLDVTVGTGAFMQDINRATELAGRMVAIGNEAGHETIAMITDMNEPLGHAIGNNLEVKEALEMLHGEGDEDLCEVCYGLAGMMLSMAKDISYEEGKDLARKRIEDGTALDKFRELVAAQGGDVSYIDDPSRFPVSPCSIDFEAESDGYVTGINAMSFGIAAGLLGAGRAKKDDVIDPCAGIIMHKKIGDAVAAGDTIATLYAADSAKLNAALAHLKSGSCAIAATRLAPPQLIYDIIR